MSKFCELAADKVLQPKVETLLLTHTVSNQNWLYMPKFILIRRVAQIGGFNSVPIHFRSELLSPISATPFVMDEFSMTTVNLKRAEGITIWGHLDKCSVYAKCDVSCRIQILVSCLIEQAYERDTVPLQTTFAEPQTLPTRPEDET